MDDSPGEEHLAFMQWAESAGIKIKGVTPARFPGRRLGMKATRTIKANETMLTIPVSLMLTIDSIPGSFTSRFPPGTSIHGIMAAFLTHGDPALLAALDPWRKVWPSYEEFADCMPVLWPEHLRVSNSSYEPTNSESERKVLLPPSISGLWNSFSKEPVGVDYDTRYQNLLSQQEKRLKDAWTHVRTAFPETKWETFAYYWCIINSRSFYYVSPGEDEPEDWNDAIGMVPFADYFNHVDDAACDVAFDGKRYTFKATRRYEKGEEIFMSYGAHSNDFLFVEYGFSLPTNPSDTIYLDDIIFSELTIAQKQELAGQEIFGYFPIPPPPPFPSPPPPVLRTSLPIPILPPKPKLTRTPKRNYEITPSGASKPTLFAASLTYMPTRDWRNYISGRSERGYNFTKSADIIRGWVGKYHAECRSAQGIIKGLLETTCSDSENGDGDGEGKVGSRAWEREKLRGLLERWVQIEGLCEGVLASGA
ncbi:ribosomal N-lysine methyltransferase [Aspergillus ellipticus CBS 707.79]|uniref:Ribosomal N-lysine methyltransferase n=1 Tax=Aspergillus ellipticus CBS 707.79 TaxID=1448320 RepID=A0A319DFT7_9EURO|nr:ribosomal N-lysine methyltransferase [Aspergillus ellipticus CBS 707.79]